MRVQVVITLPSTRSHWQTQPRPRLVTIESGVANALTKPCSPSAATKGLPMINERGAQHQAVTGGTGLLTPLSASGLRRGLRPYHPRAVSTTSSSPGLRQIRGYVLSTQTTMV